MVIFAAVPDGGERPSRATMADEGRGADEQSIRWEDSILN